MRSPTKRIMVQAVLDSEEMAMFDRLKKAVGLRVASELVRFALVELARARGVEAPKENASGRSVPA
jgi:hypothetical protein